MLDFVKLKKDEAFTFYRPYGEFSSTVLGNSCLLRCVKTGTLIVANKYNKNLKFDVFKTKINNSLYVLNKDYKFEPLKNFIEGNTLNLAKLNNPEISYKLEKAIDSIKCLGTVDEFYCYNKSLKLGNTNIFYGALYTIQMFVKDTKKNVEDIFSNVIVDVRFIN